MDNAGKKRIMQNNIIRSCLEKVQHKIPRLPQKLSSQPTSLTVNAKPITPPKENPVMDNILTHYPTITNPQYFLHADKIILPSEIQNLYNKALKQRTEFLNDLKEVAQEVGVIYRHDLEPHAIKTPASIMNKIQTSGILNLYDILRGTLVIKSPNDKDKILQALEKRGYELWQGFLKDRFQYKTKGYKSISLRLLKGKYDPLVKELQLIQHHTLDVKMNYENDTYKIRQGILRAEKMYGRSPVLSIINKFFTDFSDNLYEKSIALDQALTATILPDFQPHKGFDIKNNFSSLSSRDKNAIETLLKILKEPQYTNRPLAQKVSKILNEFLDAHQAIQV